MDREDHHISEVPPSNRMLLIFEELIEIATNADLENVVLFGMKRFFAEDTREYDLICHLKTDVGKRPTSEDLGESAEQPSSS